MRETAIKADWSDNPFVQENRKNSKAYSYTANLKSLSALRLFTSVSILQELAQELWTIFEICRRIYLSRYKSFNKQETLYEMKKGDIVLFQ